MEEELKKISNRIKEMRRERNVAHHIAKVYGVYNTFEDIDFRKLPDSFVIKCTHDSGGICL